MRRYSSPGNRLLPLGRLEVEVNLPLDVRVPLETDLKISISTNTGMEVRNRALLEVSTDSGEILVSGEGRNTMIIDMIVGRNVIVNLTIHRESTVHVLHPGGGVE